MDKRDLARFEFEMRLRPIRYIATALNIQKEAFCCGLQHVNNNSVVLYTFCCYHCGLYTYVYTKAIRFYNSIPLITFLHFAWTSYKWYSNLTCKRNLIVRIFFYRRNMNINTCEIHDIEDIVWGKYSVSCGSRQHPPFPTLRCWVGSTGRWRTWRSFPVKYRPITCIFMYVYFRLTYFHVSNSALFST